MSTSTGSPDPGYPRPPALRGLRVGIVTHYMPPHIGGIELVAETLARAYTAAGVETRWIASRVPAVAPRREDGRIRVACWNALERRRGVPWPVWGPAGAWEVARLVEWADVLHVHDCLYLGSALTAALARRARKPVLLSQHIGFVPFQSAALNAVERFAYHTLGRAVLRRASGLVFCTPGAEEFVTALLGERPATAHTIPYGIDTGRFRPPVSAEREEARRTLGLPESAYVVLFVGRLVDKKGVDLFLAVSGRNRSLHFLMVGDGPLRPARSGGADNLTWLPSLPPAQMVTAYHAADALLLPSHGEGFPLVVLEAMATGVPVIVSKGEAFTGVLEQERAGLAAARTPAALSEALDRLMETPGLAMAVAARARELVIQEWSLAAMEARYLALIRQLAARV